MSSTFWLSKRGRVWYVCFTGEKTFHSTGLTNRRDAEAFAKDLAKQRTAEESDTIRSDQASVPSVDGKQLYRFKRRGRYWYVRFSDEKIFHSTGCENRVDAEDFVHKEYLRRVRARAPDAKLRVYAADFFLWDICKWVKRQRAKNRTYSKAVAKNNRGILLNHILPRFGKRKLTEITAVEIEDWLVSLPLAGETQNHILYAFSTVLKEAKRDGIIDKNPAEEVEPVGKDSLPTSVLTDDELLALFPTHPDAFDRIWPEFQYGIMFALMVSSGMRPGEARALEWQSVLLDVPAVLIVQALNASDELGPTKGKERRGAIIPDRTAELLRRWQMWCRSNSGFVFSSIHEDFHSRKSMHNKFVKGLQHAGIRKERHITMRSLRTTYNTRMRQMLLANAMSEDILRFFIGHRSVRMTDRYDNPELTAKMLALRSLSEQVNGFWGSE